MVKSSKSVAREKGPKFAMEVAEFIIFLICLILVGTLLLVTVVIYITPNSDPKRKKLKGEESYYDPLKGRL